VHQFQAGTEVKGFLFYRSSEASFGSPPFLPIKGQRQVLSRVFSGSGMSLTTYFHLALRLKMRGVIPSLPPDVFLAWTGTA